MMYSDAEMARTYGPADTIKFSRGRVIMTAEAADGFAYGLVVKDRETGRYRRASQDSGHETATINEAKLCARLRAGASIPSLWSSSRR
jgi:hypothetical protein